MGRKLEFDKDKALKLAMESFWENGYEDTSMRELAAKLGIHLGSVYNALGDKERVFESCLRLNLDTCILPKLQKMNETVEAPAALRGYLERVVEECTHPENYPGCFLVNSLPNIANISDSVSQMLNEYMSKLDEALIACIRRGQENGQISCEKNPQEYAHFIMATAFSIRTMGKFGLPHSYMQDTKECALRALLLTEDKEKISAEADG